MIDFTPDESDEQSLLNMDKGTYDRGKNGDGRNNR